MTMPSKGTRTIQMGAGVYKYRVNRYGGEDGEELVHKVVVESPDGEVSTNTIRDVDGVTPAMVRELIEEEGL